MRVIRIMANLPVADIEAAKSFYAGYLGLSTEEFNMGWVARYTSPDTGANVQLVTRDATAPEDSVISIHTDDVDALWQRAVEAGAEVSIPLQEMFWGDRHGEIFDPFGHRWALAQHLRDIPAEEIRVAAAAMFGGEAA